MVKYRQVSVSVSKNVKPAVKSLEMYIKSQSKHLVPSAHCFKSGLAPGPNVHHSFPSVSSLECRPLSNVGVSGEPAVVIEYNTSHKYANIACILTLHVC